jgi:hypothetical protein
MNVTGASIKMSWSYELKRELIVTTDNYVIPAGYILMAFDGAVAGVVVQVYHNSAWGGMETPEGTTVVGSANMKAVPWILSDGTNIRIYNGDGSGRNVDMMLMVVG